MPTSRLLKATESSLTNCIHPAAVTEADLTNLLAEIRFIPLVFWGGFFANVKLFITGTFHFFLVFFGGPCNFAFLRGLILRLLSSLFSFQICVLGAVAR